MFTSLNSRLQLPRIFRLVRPPSRKPPSFFIVSTSLTLTPPVKSLYPSNMSTKAPRLALRAHRALQPARNVQIRTFSASPRCPTDGVYGELTAMRTRVPFIEAFKRQQSEQTSPPSVPSKETPRDLTPKSMSESFTKVILPLARDHWLLDSYINSSGHIRLGTLFMDLDALAGVVSYKHTGDSVMTVTAAVDRITLKRPLTEIYDLELSGQVTFATGRSSMEVSLQVAKAPEEGKEVKEEDILMTCAFTMVSLDPTTKKPVPISPLTTTTPHEKSLFHLGQKNYLAKKAASKLTLLKQTPNDQESDLIHALWLLQTRRSSQTPPSSHHHPRKPPTISLMKSTRMHSVQIMQPQYRNRHNFMIFGGFLLKTTFELAFTCASSISHSRPRFVALDPSTFENPVPVGSVLYLSATVVYSDSPLLQDGQEGRKLSPEGYSRIQVRVDSKVKNVEHGEEKPTGTFFYTFEVEREVKIMPETYRQFMMWLDARRRCGVVGGLVEGQEGKEGGGGVLD